MIHICSKFIVRKTILSNTCSLAVFKFNHKSWSIVFFGNDGYSMFSIKELHKQMPLGNTSILGLSLLVEIIVKIFRGQKLIKRMEVVVTNRESPVYKYAVSKGIKTHIWPPSLNESFDFGVIASFGKLIPKNVIELFLLGIFNVHASLLPKYRGGMPMAHALKNGDIVTGITISQIVHDKFDAGEIILQKPCSIGENELMPSLHRKLAIMGSQCLVEVIKTLPECLKSSFPQANEDASYAPILSKKAAVVKWFDMTAKEIFNLYRALFGNLDLQTTWKGKPVKLVCLSLNDSHFSSVDFNKEKLEPGSFTYDKKSRFLYVQCKDKPIKVCTIKFNKKMHNASTFYSGYLNKTPKPLWKFDS